jgi:hypothetical protein
LHLVGCLYYFMGLNVGNNMKSLSCVVVSPTAISNLAKFTKCHVKHRTTWCDRLKKIFTRNRKLGSYWCGFYDKLLNINNAMLDKCVLEFNVKFPKYGFAKHASSQVRCSTPLKVIKLQENLWCKRQPSERKVWKFISAWSSNKAESFF